MTWCLLILALKVLCGAHCGIRGKAEPAWKTCASNLVDSTIKRILQSFCGQKINKRHSTSPADVCSNHKFVIILTPTWLSGTWGRAGGGRRHICTELSSVPVREPVSVPALHSTPPTPNNYIAITPNHTVPSQPPRGGGGKSEWMWVYFYITPCGRSEDYIFGLHLSSFEEEKNTLPYISASHLVCIGETMQSTPVCQWRLWRVTDWRTLERFFFFLSVLVFAGKCVDGRGTTGGRGSKKRESKSWTRAWKRRSWQSAGWALVTLWAGKQCDETRGGQECRNNGAKTPIIKI